MGHNSTALLSSVNTIHHQFYAKMEQRHQVRVPNVFRQETFTPELLETILYTIILLYTIKVAFSVSDEQPSFLPKLSEERSRYRHSLTAAVGAVHTGYFQPLLSLSHLSHSASPFTFHFSVCTTGV